jgi:hypothetical protein
VLCDHCLLRGFAAGVRRIDVDIVSACAKDLQLEPRAYKEKEHVLPFPVKPIEEALIETSARDGRQRRRWTAAVLFAAVILAAGLAYRFDLTEWLVKLIQQLLETIK